MELAVMKDTLAEFEQMIHSTEQLLKFVESSYFKDMPQDLYSELLEKESSLKKMLFSFKDDVEIIRAYKFIEDAYEGINSAQRKIDIYNKNKKAASTSNA